MNMDASNGADKRDSKSFLVVNEIEGTLKDLLENDSSLFSVHGRLISTTRKQRGCSGRLCVVGEDGMAQRDEIVLGHHVDKDDWSAESAMARASW
jgi:hypothetical protein